MCNNYIKPRAAGAAGDPRAAGGDAAQAADGERGVRRAGRPRRAAPLGAARLVIIKKYYNFIIIMDYKKRLLAPLDWRAAERKPSADPDEVIA